MLISRKQTRTQTRNRTMMMAFAALGLPIIVFLSLFGSAEPQFASQQCDANPLANNGIQISSQDSSSCLKGRTPDMIDVGSCEDNSAHDINLPFPFKFLDRIYNGSIFVGSDSYVTFGGRSTSDSSLGPQNPAFPAIFIGGLSDNIMRTLSVGPDILGWRVRYEGWSFNLRSNFSDLSHFNSIMLNSCQSNLTHPEAPTTLWELLFLKDGSLQLCTGNQQILTHNQRIGAVSDGVSESFLRRFTLAPSTLYTVSTGHRPCPCANTGVKITSQRSSSCLKGKTADMIDTKRSLWAIMEDGSFRDMDYGKVNLPFSFSFLGRSFSPEDDVVVMSNSFVMFGDDIYNYRDSGNIQVPSLQIGARVTGRNFHRIKSVSVGPDPQGWRVRFEGSADYDIIWELLFSFSGIMQLCVDDHIPIMGDNASAIISVSDGLSRSLINQFTLQPSSLYTITTGLRECTCDKNMSFNKGVNTQSRASTTCLKGRTPDMRNVGRCSKGDSPIDVQLPFPFHYFGRTFQGPKSIVVNDNSSISFALALNDNPPDDTHAYRYYGFEAESHWPLFSIGSRHNQALQTLSVGSDPLGWRVRFEGVTVYDYEDKRTVCDKEKQTNIIWEMIFMFNSTLQLCTGSIMHNLDSALFPLAKSGLWDGNEFVTTIPLAPSMVYSISTSLPPCELVLSLSPAYASTGGALLAAHFPPGLESAEHDTIILTITLQGAGFSIAPNASISIVSVPPSRAFATARVVNSSSDTPVLFVSLHGVAGLTIISVTLDSVTTPLLPQNFRSNISYLITEPSGGHALFRSDSGSLIEISSKAVAIYSGLPLLLLTNNAIRSATTMTISFAPNATGLSIPAFFNPSSVVISLVGAGWSFPDDGRGRLISPASAVFGSATVTAEVTSVPVLRVDFSHVGAINSAFPLKLVVDIITVDASQALSTKIHSAILDSYGYVIASGTTGMLDAVLPSTMTVSVMVSPPLHSASVVFDVTLVPQNQHTHEKFELIIVTLTGSEFSCSSDATVKFIQPIGASGSVSTGRFASASVLTVSNLAGVFLPTFPICFYIGPCSTPNRAQPPLFNVSAAVIDRTGTTVASSTSGTLSEIFDDIAPNQPIVRLTDNVLEVIFTPKLDVPVNAFLAITLTGIALISKSVADMAFRQSTSGASGTVAVISRPLESIVIVSFSTSILAGTPVSISVSPIFGDYSTTVYNLTAVLCDGGGVIMASSYASFNATTTGQRVTVKQLIDAAIDGFILLPMTTFAGKSNCNNTIDESVPSRSANTIVEMKGASHKTIIDCSGTGMRCLIVRAASVRIVGITFKGGSSPSFISASTIHAIRTMFNRFSRNEKMASHSDIKHTSPAASTSMEFKKKETSKDSDDGHFDDGEFDGFEDGEDAVGEDAAGEDAVVEVSGFPVKENQAGGCVLVVAPMSDVFLTGVSLLNCSSVYGGGGFFKVSSFIAGNGEAAGNVATQGGGLFIAASQETDIEQFDFFNNTVVTFTSSGSAKEESCISAECTKAVQEGYTVGYDVSAAAGGGVWVQRLNLIRNCTFEDNVALAASMVARDAVYTSVERTTYVYGAHALGSGLYVLQTSVGSVLSKLHFSRSMLLCAGAGMCVSAGNMLLATVGFNTSVSDLSFVACGAKAIGNMAWSMGSCLVVSDASAGRLRIENLRSFNCLVQAAGILGGCLRIQNGLNDSNVLHISVFNFTYETFYRHVVFEGFDGSIRRFDEDGIELTSYDQSHSYGGILNFGHVSNSNVSDVTLHSITSHIYDVYDYSLHGAMIYVGLLTNSIFSSMHASNFMMHTRGVVVVNGGMLRIYEMDRHSILANISLENCAFVFSEIEIASGAFIKLGSDFTEGLDVIGPYRLSGISLKNARSICSSQCLFEGFLSVTVHKSDIPSTIQGLMFQNVFSVCSGDQCHNNAAVVLAEREGQLSFLDFFDSSFENVSSECRGETCSALGACILFRIRYGTISNVHLDNITAFASGYASFAGGSFLLHINRKPVQYLLVSNISSKAMSARASGLSSFAIGGVITALYGNITIQNCVFMNSYVSCTGYDCISSGGALAFISSVDRDNCLDVLCTLLFRDGPQKVFFMASVFHSTIRDTVVECSGTLCFATGGAIAANIAYRGPSFIGRRYDVLSSAYLLPQISFAQNKPQKLSIRVENCNILSNTIISDSEGAVLSGAGIYLHFSTGRFLNLNISTNSIRTLSRNAFVMGAGIYLSGSNASLKIISSRIDFNSAGDTGSGGAIFIGQTATLAGESLVVESNRAGKGGGLLVDGASATLSSCEISKNAATDKGGGLFCVVSSSSLNAKSTIILSNVSLSHNFILNGNPAAVGAAAYIFGDVVLELIDGTRFSMDGNPRYTTLETVLSVNRDSVIEDSTIVSCKGGSVLSVTLTTVENQNVALDEPSFEFQYRTQCVPACMYSPRLTPYTASSGFLASCIPCPRDKYSLAVSSNISDSVSSLCKPCPFGASCNGGFDVNAKNSYWGWKVSEYELSSRFMLLPPGYACEGNCTSITPCGGHRAGLLCGACTEDYSVAFFSIQCVPSIQCASWKWALLIFMCIAYQLIFSVWIFWSSESKLFQEQADLRLEGNLALKNVSLFENLSSGQLDKVLSKLHLVQLPPHTTVVTQGQPGEFMYVIKKGILRVYILDDSGRENHISNLTAPSVIGEHSLIAGSKCAATIRTSDNCQLWQLDSSCLESVTEEDKLSYVNKKRAEYSKSVSGTLTNSTWEDDIISDAFGVLMWFYQLSGSMLSVTSPLGYIDGSAVVYSVVAFFVNAKPSSDAAADLATKSTPSRPSFESDSDEENKFQFCVSSEFSVSQVYISTFIYYALWAALMSILAQKRVWSAVRSLIFQFLHMVADFASRFQKNDDSKLHQIPEKTLKERIIERQMASFEIRGPGILKWLVTCFNALSALMMQGTACFFLDGLRDAAGSRRWIYDGRVACFSNNGDMPGQWQVASAVGVALVLIAPAVLWRIMVRVERMEIPQRSAFQNSFFVEYSGVYASHARHWMVVM
jgi:CRP/FNR family cyclic AMP-dependent transcriptional regulator